ncbi:MAG: tRNA 2-selenouridine(34) synthase MnmH [Spirochaetes bacterium]|nr:tRNA 2-selenouridine(34) synthase MnmH [Spirochaetota bacterium]
MNAEALGVEAFLARMEGSPCFDVRTPDEHEGGRIPGSVNLPLFTNEQRAAVGKCYKEHGPKTAVKLGLEYVGPRMRHLVEAAEKRAPGGRVLVHCWRGGMRSGAVSWLLSFYGFETAVLRGGYKAFRRWVLDRFEEEREIRILGGMTGSGKTPLLHRMAARGAKIVDLEGLARHRGSAFGALGLADQPTQENFENLLAMALAAIPPQIPLWLEDESRQVGRCVIPKALWDRMRRAPLTLLRRSRQERISQILSEYGAFPAEKLCAAIGNLERRLGTVRMKQACALVRGGETAKAVDILLDYYDPAYAWSIRTPPHPGGQNGQAITDATEEQILGAIRPPD